MQFTVLVDLLDGDFKLVELVVARFIDARRLAGRADEHAAEQVAQARVVVPEQQQAGQQLGLAQEGAVGRCHAAHYKVVATASAGMASVLHELFGGQARLESHLVEKLGVPDQFAPVRHRVDVDLDDARIRRDLQQLQAWVTRRRVAFEHDL